MASPRNSQFHAPGMASPVGEEDMRKKYQEGADLLDNLEQLWQTKSDCENRLQRLAAVIPALQKQQQQSGTVPPELAHYMQQHKEAYEKGMQIGRVLPALEQKVFQNLDFCITACESVCVTAGTALEKWKLQQKSQAYGVQIQSDYLHEVTKRFQTAMDQAFGAWRLLSRFHTFRTQSRSTNSQMDNALQVLCQRAQMVFVRILHTSFVITTQPPMVVKNKIKLEATLLAAIDKLGFEAQSVQMNARIVSEETAAELKANPAMKEQKIATVGQIDNVNVKTKQLQRLSHNTLGFELKNIKVTVESRKQATKTGEAIMKKYYFYCTTEITFNNQTLKLQAFSLPFMVSVHGTQDVELYPRAFWDLAFSDSADSIPMIGEPEVRWHALGPALEAIFSVLTKGARRLTAHDIEYLKYRLYNGCIPEPDPVVSWLFFYKERLERLASDMNEPRRRCLFSFWEWLFRIGDTIQEKSGRDTGVSEMWEERYIEGFISKQEAESKLSQAPEPMMLIRFSDNQLAGLSIVYQDPYTREINHLVPFRFKEDIEKLTLPVMVINCKEVQDIQKIYPDKPRERIEEKVAANKRSSVEETDVSAYKPRTFVMTTGGEKQGGGRTPSYTPSPSPAHFPLAHQRSDPTPGARNVLTQGRQPSGTIKIDSSRAPYPTYGQWGTDMEMTGEFAQPQWDPQFDNLDDHRVQSILQDLMKPDDNYEMDTFVQIVQSFGDNGSMSQDGTQSNPELFHHQQPMYGLPQPGQTNFDFENL